MTHFYRSAALTLWACWLESRAEEAVYQAKGQNDQETGLTTD